MCGRYTLALEHEALRIRFGFERTEPSGYTQQPRYNIAPSQTIPVIRQQGDRVLTAMRWGLIPHWSKEPPKGGGWINARAESVAEKPSFRDAFRKGRCLVPATGFFEWKKGKDSSRKTPMFITLDDQELFAFAGICSKWTSRDGPVYTCSIITTCANERLQSLHHRMPVILRPEEDSIWLNLATPGEILAGMLRPYSPDHTQATAVSHLVNSPKNDSPGCIKPVVEGNRVYED